MPLHPTLLAHAPPLQPAARAARRWLRAAASALALVAALATPALAQNVISVPFTEGFIGTRGSSAGTANNVLTFTTLQISRLFFIQSSSTTTFELQGNDIPGTLRIVRTNGAIVEMPASANWRNSGGTTVLIGILPRPTSPVTLTYAGGSIQITNGANAGGSSIGGYFAGYNGPYAQDGDDESGNAAQSQLLTALNAYLATVVSQRPAGPVTVTAQSTASTTPVITGSATVGVNESLSVIVGGTQYTTTTSPAVVRTGTAWSLALATPLAVGTHEVTATLTNANGFTLSDQTTNELVITSGSGGTLTVGGSFTANGRGYDGTTAATGNTTGLTLVGVQGGHSVSIGSVTLAFQAPGAGTRPVTITGVTLVGTHASLYTVDLTGAPTASATIATRPATIGGSFTVADRAFDGTTTATIATNALTVVNAAPGDVLTLAGVTAAFADAAVGTSKPVTITAATLAGSAAGNYTLSLGGAPTTTASITAVGGTLGIGGSFVANGRPYDGTTTATGTTTGLALVGVQSGHTVAIGAVTLAFQSAAAGPRTVSITGATLTGPDAWRYTVDLTGAPTTSATITPAPLGVTGVAPVDRAYDGTTGVSLTGTPSYTGLVAGESFAVAGSVTATVASALVGSAKPVMVAGYQPPTANYTVTQPTGLAVAITPRPVTIGGSFTVADRTADGTTTATIATNALTVVGTVPTETLALSGVVAAFADAQPGTAKPVSIVSAALAGPTASQYALSLVGAPTTSATLAAAVAPSAPIGATTTAGEGSVTVSWTPPAQLSCGAVTGWLVDWSADGGATWTRGATPGAAARSVVLSPLVNNRAYLVRVAATNACGTGAAATAGPATPIAPLRDGQGQPRVVATGTANVTTGGTTAPATMQVAGDTLVTLAAAPTTLRLHAVDDSSVAVPVDSATRAPVLEQGGRALADGAGFAPASVVTVYLVTASGNATLIGTATVAGDGRFATALPIGAGVVPGAYTLQVVGVDATGADRAAALGIVVAPPPPDLDLAATIDRADVAPGDSVVIALVVTNRGTGAAVDVVIPRAFDEPGFAIVRAAPAQGSYDAATKSWRIPRIDPGASARLVLTAVVAATAATPTPVP